MTDYKKLTVLELRQILVERNLPSDGLKADLINRLINNDEETEKLTSENNVEKIETSVVTATNTETTNAISTEAALNVAKDITEKNGNIDDDNNKNKTTTNGAKQVPGPEEMKKLALDHLNKKLHRANKFGAEQSVIDEINRSINRVEKFGLDLQNPLAVELGLVKPQSKPKNRQPHSNRRKNRSRSNNNGMSYGGNGRNSRYRVRKGGYVSNNNNNRRGGSGRRY